MGWGIQVRIAGPFDHGGRVEPYRKGADGRGREHRNQPQARLAPFGQPPVKRSHPNQPVTQPETRFRPVCLPKNLRKCRFLSSAMDRIVEPVMIQSVEKVCPRSATTTCGKHGQVWHHPLIILERYQIIGLFSVPAPPRRLWVNGGVFLFPSFADKSVRY